MKNLVLLLTLCACPVVARAQNAPVLARAAQLGQVGQFADAQALLEAQLAQTQVKAERDQLNNALADVHFFWAMQLAKNYDFQNAIAHYLKAYESDNVLRRPDAAQDLHKIGLAYDNLSRSQEALRYYEQALPIRREVGDRRGEAATLGNIGAAYNSLSRYQEALPVLEQALVICREINERRGEAATLTNLGTANDRLSRYPQALSYFEQALPIFREINDAGGEASALNTIGVAYTNLNRNADALRAFEQALPLFRAIGDRSGEANTLSNIGSAHSYLGRTQEALRYYQQALPLRRQVQDRSGEASTLNEIGVTYINLNRFEESLSALAQALPLRREVNDRNGEAVTLNNIGFACLNLNRNAEALRNFDQALPIEREVRDRRSEATTLANIMSVHQAQKQRELAILFGKQAVNLKQSIRRDIAGLDAATQKSYLEGNKDAYQILAALLIEAGRLPEAEQISRMLRQSEIFDFVRRDADQTGATETLTLTPLERTYLARYDRLGNDAATVGERIAALEKLPAASLNAAQQTDLDKLYGDREAVEARFEVFRRELVAAFGAVTPELNTVDVAASDAWQKALGKVSAQTSKKTALLTTVIAPDVFYVILTTPTARLRFSHAIKSGDLNALVNRFREQLTNPRLDPQLAAQQLWNVMFCDGELERALQAANVEVALWSLSGSTRYVPMDSLHDGTRYLVARPRLNVVTTTVSKDYFEAPQGGRALGVGTSKAWNVQLKDDAGAVIETVDFGALTQVPAEVRGIIGNAADGGIGPMNGQILLEGDFNQSSLQSQLRRGVKTVHVATHFRLRPGDSQKSFLLLGDGNALPVFNWKVKMPLKGVELLTLSACETGLGGDAPVANKTEASGAEVGSLGEIAQLQGAGAVVVSLWSVADSSTSLLMRDFYARWQANPKAGKGEALRAAQRELLGAGTAATADEVRGVRLESGANTAPDFVRDPNHPFAHPYYWAPFTLIGNWR